MPDAGQPNYRLQDLKQRWEQNPSSRLYLQLAEEYRKAGDLAEAVEVLEQGLRSRPNDLSAHVALGKTRLELENLPEAIEALQAVIAKDPAHLVANKLLLEVYLLAGDQDRAQERLDIYRLLNDRDPELEHLSFRLDQLRRAERAGKSSEPESVPPEALETTPELDLEPLRNLLVSREEAPDADEATGSFADAEIDDSTGEDSVREKVAVEAAGTAVEAVEETGTSAVSLLETTSAGEGQAREESPMGHGATKNEIFPLGDDPGPLAGGFESLWKNLETRRGRAERALPSPFEDLEPPSEEEYLDALQEEGIFSDLGVAPKTAEEELSAAEEAAPERDAESEASEASSDGAGLGAAVVGAAVAAGTALGLGMGLLKKDEPESEAAGEPEDEFSVPEELEETEAAATEVSSGVEDTAPEPAVDAVVAETAPEFDTDDDSETALAEVSPSVEEEPVAETVEATEAAGPTEDSSQEREEPEGSGDGVGLGAAVVGAAVAAGTALGIGVGLLKKDEPESEAAGEPEDEPSGPDERQVAETAPSEAPEGAAEAPPEPVFEREDTEPELEVAAASSLDSVEAPAELSTEEPEEEELDETLPMGMVAAEEDGESLSDADGVPEPVPTELSPEPDEAAEESPVEEVSPISPWAAAAVAHAEAPGGSPSGKLSPEGDDDVATVTLGSLYLKQGHLEEAAKIFEKVLEQDPQNHAALSGLNLARGPETTGLSAMDLLADRSLSGTIPAGLTAKKILVLGNYLKHLKSAVERGNVR